jgi:hypothetical protein
MLSQRRRAAQGIDAHRATDTTWSGVVSGGGGAGAGASFGSGGHGQSSSGPSTMESAKQAGQSVADSIKGTVARVKEKLHEATRPTAEDEARAGRVQAKM